MITVATMLATLIVPRTDIKVSSSTGNKAMIGEHMKKALNGQAYIARPHIKGGAK
jgi:hypothetical protein